MTEARLWRDGRIFTGRRYDEALLVEDGRVLAVGTTAAMHRMAPQGTEVASLRGRLALPGLIDAHLHLADMTRAREGLDLSVAQSIGELLERVRRWTDLHPSGAVVGRGFDPERLREGRWPHRRDLDGAVSDRPVVIYHASGHAAVVNGMALETVGIDRATPDPRNGRIGRDPDGSPNGRLDEDALRGVASLALSAFPPGPAAIGRTLEGLASLGLTTVATMNTGPEEAAALRTLASEGHLLVRLRLYLRLSRLGEFSPSSLAPAGPPGRFAVVGTKAFTDGAFGPRTAWLSVPYSDTPGETGIAVGTDEELAAAIEHGVDLGLAPSLHAIGDRAVGRATRLLRPWGGRTSAPIRIEHAALTPPELLPVLDEVRPTLVVQPGFLWSDSWLEARLGRERARWAYVFRTLADRGHLLAGSSDAPYDPVDPWRGLQAAVHRVDPEGRSANPDPGEALALEEAVTLYTRNGGAALGAPELGMLEPGARADLVVLDATNLAAAFTAGARGVRETWVDGVRVYERPG